MDSRADTDANEQKEDGQFHLYSIAGEKGNSNIAKKIPFVN